MTLTEFLNALRILRSIDRAELADAGIQLDDREWRDFRGRPYWWICSANDQRASKLWSIIESRQQKKEERGHGEI